MMSTIRQWVRTPVVEGDEDKLRTASILNIVLWIFVIASVLYGLFAPIAPEMRTRRAVIIIPFIVILLLLKQALNRGYIRPLGHLVVLTLWLMFTVAMFFGADYNNPAFMGYLVVVICAGLILNWRAAIGWSLFSILTNAVILVLGETDILPHSNRVLPPSTFWAAQTTYIITSTILLSQTLRKIDEALLNSQHELSERKRAEEALRESEERYRLISSLSVDYVFSSTVHKDGRITNDWQSGAFEAISGYTPDEFRQRGWRTTVHPEDLVIDDGLLEKLRSNQKASAEMRLIKKNGETLWIRDYVHPVWDEKENRLAGICGSIQDIHEQKAYEEKLRRQAEEMSALYGIGLTITSNLDLDQILHGLFTKCMQLLPIDTFYIAVYDPKSQVIQHPLFYDGNEKAFIQIEDRSIATDPGLSGYVILSKATLYLPNQDDPKIQAKYKIILTGSRRSRSYVGVPMFFHGAVVGVLSMQKYEPNAYSPEQVRLLETIATQAAVAIENARLYQAEQERRRIAETLRRAATAISSILDSDTLIEEVLTTLKLLIPYDSVSVFFHEKNQLRIAIAKGYPNSEEMKDQTFPDNDEFFQAAKMSGQPIILKDAQKDARFKHWGNSSSVRGWMVVPLISRGRVIGAITLDSLQPEAFDEHVGQTAMSFAYHAAAAIENARLYTEIQQELNERKKMEAELIDSEQRYRGLFEQSQDGIAIMSLDRRIIKWNKKLNEMTGTEPEFGSEAVTNVSIPGEEDAKRKFARVISGEKIPIYERIFIKDDGTSFVAEINLTLVRDPNGNPWYVQSIIRDITKRKRAEEALRANEEKVRELNASLEKRVEERTEQLQAEKARIERIADEVAALRKMSDFLQASTTIEEASNVTASHMNSLFANTSGGLYLLGNGFSDLNLMSTWGNFKAEAVIQPNECWGMRRGRVFVRHPADASPPCIHFGETFQAESICLPLLAQSEAMGILCLHVTQAGSERFFNSDVQNLLVASADSIALALANLRLRERLHNQSIRDPLTGIFNRRYMEETLIREIHRASRSQRPLCVIMFEVDNFKQYNNTYGHEAGDYVLRKVADTMSSKLRRSDFPCRYGGDEFTLILPDTTLEDGAHRAEDLRKAVEALALSFNNQALGVVTVRMGVAAYPKHGEAVLQVADDASYRARAIGKNCVVVAE